MRPNRNIVIVGAGASGLMAASILAEHNYKVTVLEARDRVGGRIQTLHSESFSLPVELGAEFIHGPAIESIKLLNEAGIAYEEAGGSIWRYEDEKLKRSEDFVKHASTLERHLQNLKEESSVREFLDTHFSGDPDLYTTLQQYVEGYDLADIDRASALSFKEEWLDEEAENQWRCRGGYDQLINHLQQKAISLGVVMHLNSSVTNIEWSKNAVIVTGKSESFHAEKVILTVPVGILGLNEEDQGCIHFSPAIPVRQLAHQLGFGSVTKVLIEFKQPIWKNTTLLQSVPKEMSGLGFLFSDESIPTWWTQEVIQNNLLTGWLSEFHIRDTDVSSEESILRNSITSLSRIFNCEQNTIEDQILAFACKNWKDDIYSRGAYSYTTTTSSTAINLLNAGFDNTIFFAGEALVEEGETGTVEAALKSGKLTAGRILRLD